MTSVSSTGKGRRRVGTAMDAVWRGVVASEAGVGAVVAKGTDVVMR